MTGTHQFILHADLAANLSAATLAECRVVLEDLGVSAAIKPVGPQFTQWSLPYNIVIYVRDGRLEITIRSHDQLYSQIAIVPLTPMRSLIRDYDMLCKSHAEAMNSATPYRLEAIDMGRRSIHNEGADYVTNALQSSLEIDFETARRLFTLVTFLHRRMGDMT